MLDSSFPFVVEQMAGWVEDMPDKLDFGQWVPWPCMFPQKMWNAESRKFSRGFVLYPTT
jgi:hypothetical protein